MIRIRLFVKLDGQGSAALDVTQIPPRQQVMDEIVALANQSSE
jgi:hypothetical protein